MGSHTFLRRSGFRTRSGFRSVALLCKINWNLRNAIFFPVNQLLFLICSDAEVICMKLDHQIKLFCSKKNENIVESKTLEHPLKFRKAMRSF